MTAATSRAWLVLLGLLLSVEITAQQRWYELYDDAIQHIKQQQWEQAEAKLLQAQKLQARSGRNVLRYGMLRTDYFPEYYLGIVYLSTNRPKQALQMFELARKANINERSEEFRQISALQKQAADLSNVRAEGPRPAEVKKEADRPPEKPAEIPPLSPPVSAPAPSAPTPDFRAEFEKLFGTARGYLQQGNLVAAEESANAARDLAIRRNLAAERPRAESLLSQIGASRSAARVEDAVRRRDALTARRELDALVAAAPGYDASSLRAGVERLERDIQSSQLHRGAMRAFFEGNYQQSLQLLTQAEKVAPLSPRGYFYRACSLAALASTAANPDEDRRLADARQSFRLAARQPNDFRRDLTYISPKIRGLLGVR